jgi:hypothetical protein
VKESVEYYVDSNQVDMDFSSSHNSNAVPQEPDFVDDENIYDHLDLVEDETLGNIGHLEEHHVADAEKEVRRILVLYYMLRCCIGSY